MTSSPASVADTQVMDAAKRSGIAVSARQLTRWRQAGAIPAAHRRGLGRGRGSTSEYTSDEIHFIVEFARHAGPKRRPSQIVMWLFLKEFDVPEVILRKALIDELDLIEAFIFETAGTTDVVDAVDSLAVKAPRRRSPQTVARRRQMKATYRNLLDEGLLEPAEDLVRGTVEPPSFKAFEERLYLNLFSTVMTGEAIDTPGLTEVATEWLQHACLDDKPERPDGEFVDDFAHTASEMSFPNIRQAARDAPFVALMIGRNLCVHWEPLTVNYPIDLDRPPDPGDSLLVVAGLLSFRQMQSMHAGRQLDYDDVIQIVLDYERAGQDTFSGELGTVELPNA